MVACFGIACLRSFGLDLVWVCFSGSLVVEVVCGVSCVVLGVFWFGLIVCWFGLTLVSCALW